MEDDLNLTNIQINCSGLRKSLFYNPFDDKSFYDNYVTWCIAESFKEDKEPLTMYYDWFSRLKKISKGLASERDMLFATSQEHTEKYKELDSCFEADIVCFKNHIKAEESPTWLVKEEDFVREFHEELRLYEYCHITDDKHWPLFEKSGKIGRSTENAHPYDEHSNIHQEKNLISSNSNLIFIVSLFLLILIIAFYIIFY